ncbi:MarR family winged helix-turn-helix transcriptional regulator [Paenibacillus sp. MMS18-CY102]|uniref:MarR family winged helix-turn-helix transcriptional regulator n=1 Tax=Paenibacillus sp. MMS18-CY102 TaxID=2682849 RepID=UPI001366785E|nr:MarR family transcriptional regulator [Paenibacillus sp. MMS18-CY102]MWC31252.1 MarR family transcriptional regulator [Paenibacillus sp. MMS18-CY102]
MSSLFCCLTARRGAHRIDTRETGTLEELDWLFRKMVRKFVKERDKITIEGITLPGLMILNKIVRDGEQRLSDLAEELDFTSGAITALCDKLEEKHFAVRNRKPEDRRTVLLDITAQGRAMLDRHKNIGPSSIDVLFGGFTAEELDVQKQTYRRMIDNLERLSETILSLAKDNAEQPDNVGSRQQQPQAAEMDKPQAQTQTQAQIQTQSQQEKRNFISY